ncbi:MAG: hypothetical protein E5X59_02670 [Mesorhizobium sp.]|nr:MAG: hypothetical protein E5X59_02670 [Mesorhizobium sp.]
MQINGHICLCLGKTSPRYSGAARATQHASCREPASSSGGPLLEASAIGSLTRNLMPLCRLVTPDLVELAILAGSRPAVDDCEILRQGQGLLATGSQIVLAKGGHATGPRSTEILLRSGQEPISFDAPRLAGSMRGTGCLLACAIAAHLANGRSLEHAVGQAKQFVFAKL